MDSSIQIIEKPDWVSWDDIHEVLVKAHATNRARGIIMRKPSLPGEEIKKEIGEEGIMLVALDGEKVVGTAALLTKHKNSWYVSGDCGYMCFASVLSEYAGKGVYRQLCRERERIAKEKGLFGLYFDTHHNNNNVVKIALRNGFHQVGAITCKDHWNVVLFKWLKQCPYSRLRCWFEYNKRKMIVRSKVIIKALFKKAE